jgi:poly(3-hydroxybutyrate) depolymerase
MKKLILALTAVVAVSGCAVTQPQGTPVPQRLETEPVTGRQYYIYVPSTYRKDQPCPLIVTCHGTPPYDIAEHHIREWKMLGEQNRCIVVAPVLTATDGIFGDGPIVGMLEDERYIMSLISSLGHQYNIDLNNIMITGFSGGGFPMYFVGLRHPDLFSTVVARNCNFSEPNLAGWFPPDSTLLHVMVYYGETDPGVIQNQSQNALRFLRSSGFNVESTVIPGVGHERHPEYAMEFFRKHWRQARPSLPMETR